MEYILLLCSQVRFMIMPSEDGNDEHVTMMSMIINETKVYGQYKEIVTGNHSLTLKTYIQK